MEERNDQDWRGEVETTPIEIAWSSQGQMVIRCWFRMRSGTAGLFAAKKRYGLCGDEKHNCETVMKEMFYTS